MVDKAVEVPGIVKHSVEGMNTNYTSNVIDSKLIRKFIIRNRKCLEMRSSLLKKQIYLVPAFELFQLKY